MMEGTELSLPAGDYMTPAFETAHVADAMRVGVFTCAADTALLAVARIMATHHIHSVVVNAAARVGERRWAVVSDLDLIRAADSAHELLAADVARSDAPATTPDALLREAAETMATHGVTHLVVEDAATHEPIGMLSTLDVAGNLAWARG